MRPFLLLLTLSTVAIASTHRHPPRDAAIHEQFYKEWMRPDNPGMSCCSDKDCYPTEAHFKNGHWWARNREDGQYIQIPQEKVERARDNPDGRSHVCMTPGGFIWCFIPGGGA